MSYSIPPNEATEQLLKIFGLHKSNVTEIHIHIKTGEVPQIEIKQLISVKQLSKVVEILRKYKFNEDV